MVFHSGNRNLKAEKSLTNEIYSSYNFNEKLKFNSTFFNNRIYDQIEYKNNKYINNTDNIDLNQNGLDNTLIYKNKNSNISIYSTLLSSNKKDGSPQLRRPEKTYGINFIQKFNSKFVGNFNLNLDYKHYGKHFDTNSKTFKTIEMDSTDIVNFSLNKKINKILYYFNSSNIFNEIYQRPHGYSQDRRLFRFGIKIAY